MNDILSDLSEAFGYALNADPLTVLLPLAIVAIAQGLRADGIGAVFSNTTRGLVWFSLLVVLVGGLMADDRFEVAGWQARAEDAWNELMGIRFMEVMGFWLLLFAGIVVVSIVRSIVRR
ncbi:hypothetical protein [Parvularcula lutaonensis]|uniref:Uncharacterized protein n=1 Tax=Parvularcula lutaonensis TaxID=491923 RepID=A0ABV7M9X3_9PROT|nr:hypothetical protein [Parvularcula lutaonensis]GGY36236.1 hypothetical protein GCM10007148_00480 [Parvularcula lutaonensis]